MAIVRNIVLALLAAGSVSADACNADNCLRALRATSVLASASAFCSSYMGGHFTGTTPTYAAAPCSSSAARISSACVCLAATASPSTSTATTTSTSTTTTTSTSTSKSTAAAATACNADNCLRALRATTVLASASAFCSSYIGGKFTGTTPTYAAAPCSSSAARISSACVCLTATAASSPATMSTSTTTSASVCTSTVFTTQPVCTSTTTIGVTDTSTSTAIRPTYPTNVVLDSGFEENFGGIWYVSDVSQQQDSPGYPAHSGQYFADFQATGPLPDGTGESDASLSQDVGPQIGNFVFSVYYYIVSVTSTDATDPSCTFTINLSDQNLLTQYLDSSSPSVSYYSIQPQGVYLDGSNQQLSFLLTCDPSTSDGQYSAELLVDDVYLFGAYTGCDSQQR